MSLVRPIALVVILPTLACGSDGGSSPDGAAPAIDAHTPDAVTIDARAPDAVTIDAPTPDGQPPPTRTINGSVIDHYYGEAGMVAVPEDLSGDAVMAFVPDGHGGFTTYPGSGTAAGTFTIPAVPEGLAYIDAQGYFLVTAENDVDLGEDLLGSPQPGTVGSDSTMLTADLTGVTDVADFGEYFVLQNDLRAAPFTVEGRATGGSDYVASSTWSSLLVDADHGDVLRIADLTPDVTAEAVAYRRITGLATLAPFTMTVDQTTTVSGSFVPAAPLTARLDLRRSQFAALATGIHPDAVLSGVDVTLGTSPPAAGAPATLAIAASSEATDVATTFTYGDPYPADWLTYVVVNANYTATILLPGTSSRLTYVTSAGLEESVADATAGAVVPMVGAVTSPTVGGRNAFADQTGVGTTPTLTWTAPAIGSGVGYELTIYELVTDASGDGSFNYVTDFLTRATSLTIPPGLLSAGKTYFATVQAAVQSGASIDKNPFRFTLPFAYITTVTASFSP